MNQLRTAKKKRLYTLSIGNHTMSIPRKAQRGSLLCSILAGVAITSSIQIRALYKLKKKSFQAFLR